MDNGYDARSVGKRVGAYRRAAGMTAEDLAAAVGGGLTRTAVAKLENGHRVDISTELLVQLAWALQVPPMVLLFPLEDRQKYIAVGDTSGTAESLGYWLEGIDLPAWTHGDLAGSRPTGATRVGNGVLSAYGETVVSAIGFLESMIGLIDLQENADELRKKALGAAADRATSQLKTARELLDVLRRQLGLEDG